MISRFPDQELKFLEPGNFLSGPEKSGIGKSELAIPKLVIRLMYHVSLGNGNLVLVAIRHCFLNQRLVLKLYQFTSCSSHLI